MKILLILMTTLLMQVSASTFAQKITLNEKEASLISIFEKINKQSGVDFLVNIDLLAKAKPVSITVDNEELSVVLSKIFEDQPLEYTVKDRAVLVTKKTSTFLERLANRWAAIDVRGRVVDQEGKPLLGATVKIKSTGKSLSTNGKGEFYIEKVDEGEVLVVSFIGYVSREVSAVKEMGNVVLELSDSKLDEVQVIAYGETTRRLSTGNISSITAKDIEKQPVTNPLLALSGRVPGVFIEQATGLPGGAVKVRIQGTNSFRWDANEPLYVIDGVPYLSKLIDGIDPEMPNVGSAGSPLNFINPSDIERIDVLKDADATSIYGSRAANGAILITTKKGKAGAMKVDVNLQKGIGQMTRRIKLLNTEQYLEMRKEAARNDNLDYAHTPPFSSPSGPYKDLLSWDQNRYTDWQKELLGGAAHYDNYVVSISGGSNNSNYLLGATYNRQTSVFEGDAANSIGNVHFNLNSSSANQKFRAQFTGSYQYNLNNLLGMDLTERAITLPPNAPALFNPDGSLNWARASDGISTWDFQNHPLDLQFNKYQNKTNNLVANSILSYQLFSGLELKSSFGYTNLQANEFKIFPVSKLRPELQSTDKGRSTFGNNYNHSWLIEPQITYKWSLQEHSFDVLIGSSFQQNKAVGQRLRASEYSTDQVLEDIAAAPYVNVIGSTNTVYKYTALYGRLNYAYDDRYILNFNARRDGSSRFGPANRFHNFASAGAAWLFSNETAVKDLFPLLSFGKLRASYGTTGNDQIGDYGYMNLYYPEGVPRPYQGIGGVTPAGLNNPYFQWEETRKLSIGLDFGFVKDRVLLTANYSRNRSSNQLRNYDLPIFTGFEGLTVNFPAVIQNTSWEFLLNTVNIQSGSFRWSSNINLTIPRNKLAAYPDLASSSYANDYIVGKSINFIKKYHWLGVSPETGLHEFETRDGGVTSNPNDPSDRIVVLSTDPKYYGGIQNSVSWKDLSLDVFIAFTHQLGENYQNGWGGPGASARNQPADVLKRWQQKGDITEVQRYGRAASTSPSFYAFAFSDGRFSDASYLRVKNISLSWQLPESWKQKVHLRNCRVFLQGQNLFTISNYIGLDPESRSTASLPPLRVITTGIQITL